MRNLNKENEATMCRRRNFYTIAFLVFLATAIYAAVTYSTKSSLMADMLYNGYCPETEKIMTDADKIYTALTQITQSRGGMLYREQGGHVDKKRILSYKTPEEILEESPSCCQVHYCSAIDCKPITDAKGTWRDIEPYRKNGLYAGHVSINYKVDYVDENGDRKTGEIRELNLITNCGKYFFPT